MNDLTATDSHPGRKIPRDASKGGFSLIEILGGLAILAVLALALVPVLMKEYDRLARDTETRQLAKLTGGLRTHIFRNRSIPDHTGFAQAIANELGLQISDVTLNSRRQPRVLLLDPAITNAIPLPYSQTRTGITTSIPLSLGVLLVSSVGKPLPAGIISGFSASSSAFSNVWATAENGIPAGWNWTGNGADLRIARLNLGTLFAPVSLTYDAYASGLTNRGRFTVDGSTTNTLPTTPAFLSQYLIGTVIGLHHHAGTSGTLQVSVVLQNPVSFFYQGGAWRGQSFLGRGMRPTSALDVQAAHDLFAASPINTEAQGSPPATPALVVAAMTTFMQEFIEWRNAGYPRSHRDLDDAQDDLDNVTSDLLHHASSSGSSP